MAVKENNKKRVTTEDYFSQDGYQYWFSYHVEGRENGKWWHSHGDVLENTLDEAIKFVKEIYGEDCFIKHISWIGTADEYRARLGVDGQDWEGAKEERAEALRDCDSALPEGGRIFG